MDFVIVTGMSGAGKNTAIKLLEDCGYFCVDNLPVSLIDKFAELALESPQNMDRIALGIDVRGGETLDTALASLDRLSGKFVQYRLLFMDAADDCLLKRYKETRRIHPLSGKTQTLEEAFSLERELLKPMRERADYIIDTEFLKVQELRDRLYEIFIRNAEFRSLNVTIETFGYKYGIPEECDYVIDTRFLPNPYYEPDLKEKSGLDSEVQAYVLGNSVGKQFMERLNDMFAFLIPEFMHAGKNSLVIGIGCTGGRHRSVSVASGLFEALSRDNAYGLKLYHRDLDNNRR